MVRTKKGSKELFWYLDLPKIGERDALANTIAMMLEFSKYQGEVVYEIGKRQAIMVTSAASSIGVGWSAFFYGVAQGSWLSASLGMMMAFAATFILAYWTPRAVDGLRESLDNVGATKFYNKWLVEPAKFMLTQKKNLAGSGQAEKDHP